MGSLACLPWEVDCFEEEVGIEVGMLIVSAGLCCLFFVLFPSVDEVVFRWFEDWDDVEELRWCEEEEEEEVDDDDDDDDERDWGCCFRETAVLRREDTEGVDEEEEEDDDDREDDERGRV